MPKNLMQQRRGKGSPIWRYSTHRAKYFSSYREYDERERTDSMKAVITDLVHVRGKTAPFAEIKFENGEVVHVVAPEGIYVGQSIESGAKAEVKAGNIVPLTKVPEGTLVSNIEINPGDGGRVARGAGNSGIVVGKDKNSVLIMLPSKEVKKFNPKSRATVGAVAGGGAGDKPFLKAGTRFYTMRNRISIWPVVRGVAMNSVNHPFGGGGKPGKTVSRHASPGRKVGSLAASRTGRRKRK